MKSAKNLLNIKPVKLVNFQTFSKGISSPPKQNSKILLNIS